MADRILTRALEILDGDTYREADGTAVRLSGANTPELAHPSLNIHEQPGGRAAQAAAAHLLQDGYTARSTGESTYGRDVKRVQTTDGRDVASTLIRNGLAEPSFGTPDDYALDLAAELYPERHRDTDMAAFRAMRDADPTQFGDPSTAPWYKHKKIDYGTGATFKAAIARGTDQFQGSLYKAAEWLGDVTGSERLAEWGEEGFLHNMQEAALNPARIRSYDDVDSLYEGWLYFVETLGEQAPQLLVDAGLAATGAGVGAIAGRRMAAAGAMKALARKMGPDVPDKLARHFAAAQRTTNQGMAQGAKRGAQAAFAGAIAPQMLGESYRELQDAGVDDPWLAASAAAINTGLEAYGLNKLLSLVSSGAKDKAIESVAGIAREALTRGGQGIGVEAGTEFAQGLVNQLAIQVDKPEHEIDWHQLIDAGIRGGIVGGTLGGAGGTLQGTNGYFDTLRERSFTREPVEDLTAQADDLVNPDTPRDTVITQPEDTQTVVDRAAEAGLDVQVTAQPDGADKITTAPEKATIDTTEAERAASLQIETPKDQLDPNNTVVAAAVTPDGAVIKEEAVRTEDAQARAQALADERPGSEARVLTLEEMHARRAAANEQLSEPAGPTRPAQKVFEAPPVEEPTAPSYKTAAIATPSPEALGTRSVFANAEIDDGSTDFGLIPKEEAVQALNDGTLDIASLEKALREYGIDAAAIKGGLPTLDRRAMLDELEAKGVFLRGPEAYAGALAIDRSVSDHEILAAAKQAGVKPRYARDFQPALMAREIYKKLENRAGEWLRSKDRNQFPKLFAGDKPALPSALAKLSHAELAAAAQYLGVRAKGDMAKGNVSRAREVLTQLYLRAGQADTQTKKETLRTVNIGARAKGLDAVESTGESAEAIREKFRAINERKAAAAARKTPSLKDVTEQEWADRLDTVLFAEADGKKKRVAPGMIAGGEGQSQVKTALANTGFVGSISDAELRAAAKTLGVEVVSNRNTQIQRLQEALESRNDNAGLSTEEAIRNEAARDILDAAHDYAVIRAAIQQYELPVAPSEMLALTTQHVAAVIKGIRKTAVDIADAKTAVLEALPDMVRRASENKAVAREAKRRLSQAEIDTLPSKPAELYAALSRVSAIERPVFEPSAGKLTAHAKGVSQTAEVDRSDEQFARDKQKQVFEAAVVLESATGFHFGLSKKQSTVSSRNTRRAGERNLIALHEPADKGAVKRFLGKDAVLNGVHLDAVALTEEGTIHSVTGGSYYSDIYNGFIRGLEQFAEHSFAGGFSIDNSSINDALVIAFDQDSGKPMTLGEVMALAANESPDADINLADPYQIEGDIEDAEAALFDLWHTVDGLGVSAEDKKRIDAWFNRELNYNEARHKPQAEHKANAAVVRKELPEATRIADQLIGLRAQRKEAQKLDWIPGDGPKEVGQAEGEVEDYRVSGAYNGVDLSMAMGPAKKSSTAAPDVSAQDSLDKLDDPEVMARVQPLLDAGFSVDDAEVRSLLDDADVETDARGKATPTTKHSPLPQRTFPKADGSSKSVPRPSQYMPKKFVDVIGGSRRFRTAVNDIVEFTRKRLDFRLPLVVVTRSSLRKTGIPADVIARLEARLGDKNSAAFVGAGQYGVIVVPDAQGSMSGEQIVAFSHELGHAFFESYLAHNGNREAKAELYAAYREAVGKEASADGYKEWAADQVAHWLGDRSDTILGGRSRRVAQRLMAMLAQLWQQVKATLLEHKYVGETFDDFMRGVMRSTANKQRTSVRELHTEVLNMTPRARGNAVWSQAKQVWSKGAPIMKAVAASVHARLRDLSPEIAAAIYQESVAGKVNKARAFQQRYVANTERWSSQIDAVEQQIAGKATLLNHKQRDAKLKAAWQAFREGKDTADAKQLRALIDKIHAEAASDVPVFVVRPDFIPEAFDHAALSDKRVEFERALVSELEITPEAAVEVVDSILGVAQFDVKSLAPGKPVSTHAHVDRVLRNEALRRFATTNGLFLDNPNALLHHYADGLAKRASWEAVFGGYAKVQSGKEKLTRLRILKSLGVDVSKFRTQKALVSYAEELGVEKNGAFYSPNAKLHALLKAVQDAKGGAAAQEVLALIDSGLGRSGQNMPETARRAQDWIITGVNTTVLAFSGVASIPEIMGGAIRGQAFTDWKDVLGVMAELKDAKKLAFEIGAILTDGAEQAKLESMGPGYQSPLNHKINQWFFALNGQQFVTRMSRAVSAGLGARFLVNAAKAAKKGDVLATKELERFHISAEEMIQWHNNGRGDSRAVHAAISQFVYESTIRPSRWEATAWGNNAYLKMAWHLKQFFYSYGKVLLGGIWRNTAQRYNLARDAGAGRLPAAALSSAPILVAGGLLLPLAAAAQELREGVTGVDRTERLGPAAYAGMLFSKAGGLGPLEIIDNMLEAGDYGRSPIAAFTPVTSKLETLMGSAPTETKLRSLMPFFSQNKRAFDWVFD